MNQHIIQGKPAAFQKSANSYIGSCGVSTDLTHVSHVGGQVCAVIQQRHAHPSSKGSLIEVKVLKDKDPSKVLADLQKENSMWQCDAAFPVAAEESAAGKKSAASTIAVFTRRQP